MFLSFHSIEHLSDTHRPSQISLEPYAVHLWGMKLDGSQRCVQRCIGWLDEFERQRAARLVRENTRQRFVLAHGGLRAVLSAYLGVDPGAIMLDRSQTGKPFLTRELRDRSAITFNLSHAQNRALIAVSKTQEVGVDLECVREDIEVANLSERYFTHAEHRAIMQATEEQRAMRFFRHWVAKEALLKAQGIGLRGLADCEVFIAADGFDTEARARLGPQFDSTLRVRLLACEPGWEAAIAAHSLDSLQQCSLDRQ